MNSYAKAKKQVPINMEDLIPFTIEKEWDENRTSFGGQQDPKVKAFMEGQWGIPILNPWFGQKSLFMERPVDKTVN